MYSNLYPKFTVFHSSKESKTTISSINLEAGISFFSVANGQRKA
ncbi:hypothetical protein [Sporosarcina sp. USHLN248]